MMLTSRPIPVGQDVKSLTASLPREEAKTPEIETVLQSEPIKHDAEINELKAVKNVDFAETKAEESLLSSLSERALKVKENLTRKEEIVAVLLKPDGSSEEIKYIASSKQLNRILNGRPTIVGEIEEIGVIVVRSLNQMNCDEQELNQNILPPPFCNKQFYGNYLLFGVDEDGHPINFSLKQYQEVVDKNKDLTQHMRKNYNYVDNKEIKTQSTFHSDSIYLRSEVDKKIRREFRDKNGRNPLLSEIEDKVNKAFQDLVNELAITMPSNRMVDPDYNPQEDGDKNYNPIPKKEAEELDWRLQLNEALKYVRERGRFDGDILAEKLAETFYELNGTEATLNELIEVFKIVKTQLVQNELESFENEERNKFNLIAKDLVYRAKSTFLINNGRTPTRDELKQSIEKLASELVNRALRMNESVPAAVSPVDDKMLQTPITKSKTGISETYDLYFDDFSTKRKERNLLKAIKSFKMRNKRQPTIFEIQQLKEFLATNNETTLVQFGLSSVDEKKEEKTSKLLVSPIQIKKGNAAQYNIYFENENFDENANEKQAIKWFNRFNHREPTEFELDTIKRFIKYDKKEELIEYNFPLNDRDENKIKITTDYVIKKKTSTKYVLNFNVDINGNDENERQNGDEKQAIQWFKRFNNREPTDIEKQKIKQFVQYDDDDDDIIDID